MKCIQGWLWWISYPTKIGWGQIPICDLPWTSLRGVFCDPKGERAYGVEGHQREAGEKSGTSASIRKNSRFAIQKLDYGQIASPKNMDPTKYKETHIAQHVNCPNPGEIRVASWFTSESSSNRPQTRPMGEEHFLLAAAQVILGGFSSRGINSWKGRKISSGQTVGQTWDWCWWRSSIPFFPAALNIFQLAPHWLFQFLAVNFFE